MSDISFGARCLDCARHDNMPDTSAPPVSVFCRKASPSGDRRHKGSLGMTRGQMPRSGRTTAGLGMTKKSVVGMVKQRIPGNARYVFSQDESCQTVRVCERNPPHERRVNRGGQAVGVNNEGKTPKINPPQRWRTGFGAKHRGKPPPVAGTPGGQADINLPQSHDQGRV